MKIFPDGSFYVIFLGSAVESSDSRNIFHATDELQMKSDGMKKFTSLNHLQLYSIMKFIASGTARKNGKWGKSEMKSR